MMHGHMDEMCAFVVYISWLYVLKIIMYGNSNLVEFTCKDELSAITL